MLHIYISHAPADRAYVEQFMQWVRPMQARYPFRIWFDHREPDPIVPWPWNVIFFWYSPRSHKRPYNRNMPNELDKAHVYLFFTSQKSITTPWIESLEIPAAVERYQQMGQKLVRIYPVLVAGSQWRISSRLAAFKPLGPAGKPISLVKPNEDAWAALMEDLRKVIIELNNNHIQHNRQLALPTDSFTGNTSPEPWVDTPEVVLPLSNWLGWLVVGLTAFFAVAWLAQQIKPSHKEYWPKKEIPKSQLPPPVLPTVKPPALTDTLTPSGGRIRPTKE